MDFANQALLRVMWTMRSDGYFEEAENILRTIARFDRDAKTITLALGACADLLESKFHETSQADDLITQAIANVHDGNAYIIFALGILIVNQCVNHARGLQCFQSAMRFPVIRPFANDCIGIIYEHAYSDYPKALEHYKQSAVLFSKGSSLHLRFASRHNLPDVSAIRDRLALMTPAEYILNHPVYRAIRAEEIDGNFDEAQRLYELALVDPDPLVNVSYTHFEYAMFLTTRRHHYGAAAMHFEQAIQGIPRYCEAYYRYGLLLFQHLKQYEAARERFESVLYLNADHFDAREHLQLIDRMRMSRIEGRSLRRPPVKRRCDDDT